MSLRVLALAFVALATASAAKTDVRRPIRIGLYNYGNLMATAFPLTDDKVLLPAMYMSSTLPEIRERPLGIPVTDSGNIYYPNRLVYNPNYGDYMNQQYQFAIVTLDRKIELEDGQKIPEIPKGDVTVSPGEVGSTLRKAYPSNTAAYPGYDLETVDLVILDPAQCAEPCGTTFTDDFICAEVTTVSEDPYSMPLDAGSPLVVGKHVVGVSTQEAYCASSTSTMYAFRKISTLGDFIQV